MLAVLEQQPDLSMRQAAQVAGVAINTARKVAAAVDHIFDPILYLLKTAPTTLSFTSWNDKKPLRLVRYTVVV